MRGTCVNCFQIDEICPRCGRCNGPKCGCICPSCFDYPEDLPIDPDDYPYIPDTHPEGGDDDDDSNDEGEDNDDD